MVICWTPAWCGGSHYEPRSHAQVAPNVVMEVFQGVLDKVDFQRTRKALNGFSLLDMDTSVVQLAMRLQQQYILLHQLGIPDALIAATALVYDFELRTYNLKDFRFIPGIRVSDRLS